MAENEKTSAEVATIASEILKMDKPYIMTDKLWADIKTLAGSALTQTADKPKVKLPNYNFSMRNRGFPLPLPLNTNVGFLEFLKKSDKNK